MRFGEVDTRSAEGAILAHSLRGAGFVFKKGRTLSAEDVARLTSAGHKRITVAQLDPGDIHEDPAAARLAAAIAGPDFTASTPFTGRVNLFAGQAGLVVVDRDRFDRINAVDEALTVATVPHYARVAEGQMVATIKVIPFAASAASLSLTEAIAEQADRTGHHGPVIRLAPFRPHRIGLIQTWLPGMKRSILAKTVDITRARIEGLGSTLVRDRQCEHKPRTLAGELRTLVRAGLDMVLIAGASAITDRRDVLPEAVELAGGSNEHFGMPVDPGNLLLLARIGSVPVLGLPGCARSPKLNGYDWVLERLAADLPVTRKDIVGMGIGGLLTEIPTRPLPRGSIGQAERGTKPAVPAVAAIVLAAGQSRRMGAANKLTETIAGKPMVRHAVEAALSSKAAQVLVVTGYQAEAVQAALNDLPVSFVHNPAFAAGLSTSLKAGVAAAGPETDAALICLGDMPLIGPALLDRMIAAYDPLEGRAIVLASADGKRGNPVLFDRRFFDSIRTIEGDVGARHLIGDHAELVVEIDTGDTAPLTDIDTPDALAAIRQSMDDAAA